MDQVRNHTCWDKHLVLIHLIHYYNHVISSREMTTKCTTKVYQQLWIFLQLMRVVNTYRGINNTIDCYQNTTAINGGNCNLTSILRETPESITEKRLIWFRINKDTNNLWDKIISDKRLPNCVFTLINLRKCFHRTYKLFYYETQKLESTFDNVPITLM